MESARNTGNGSGSKSLPGSGDPHVQEVMRAAHEELKQLLRQRGDIMKRIGTVKQTIVGLANLFGDDVLSEELLELVDRKSSGRQPGFTKACRMVLMEADRPLGAREVCEHIQQRTPPVCIDHMVGELLKPLLSLLLVRESLDDGNSQQYLVYVRLNPAFNFASRARCQSASDHSRSS